MADPTPALNELDAIIAARVDFEEMFWRSLGSIRREGKVSANEIARRVHAAGIASRPTTLDRLRPYSAAAVAAEAMNSMANSARAAMAPLSRLVEAFAPGPVVQVEFALADQVAEVLGDREGQYDLDAIVAEISQTFGLGGRAAISSIHQIPAPKFWEIVERHPAL
ncbi:hypothetical protein [Actinomadura harenae]|uniref:Uncharacterized protein n=1 Tax=Actinomadura harenae TaxID=2483351 RepID=A0A3M2LR53_9ACTN|nr:hypothetical protein [Actinomadura harenae]RMI39867.1 hypothetical protein EBO15_28275 [Actinomadura harenae]